MKKEEKGFNLKLYAVIAVVAVTAILAVVVTFTFKSKYTAFHPDEVARNYADTIVQTGDGYNAYKNALVSKNQKYGDFIRKNYMNPVIYSEAGYKPGDDTKKLKGFNDASYKGELTENDNGALQGQVIDRMYEFYKELVADGWDDYDKIFTEYFAELARVRKEVFDDYYMTDEIMFTALESNVKKYGEYLTGTEDEFDENTGNQTSFKTIGIYQDFFGEDYKLTTVVADEKDVNLEEYKANLDADKLAICGVSADEISEAKCFTVNVKTEDDIKVASADIMVVKIGSSWYVDSDSTSTKTLIVKPETK